MRKQILILIAVFSFSISYAQKYEVKITPIKIEGLGGLQSYAVGTYNGDWLLVGGRLDGLHRRQPWASFDADGKNQDLIVVNPATKSIWRKPLTDLPTSIKEQLSSTNMQFYQDDKHLICTGGYGYSPSEDDHITYPYLSVIDLEAAIMSIKAGESPTAAIKQTENEIFRVTGGALNKINDTFYLVGGHKFMGRYNPMGPNNGPGFVQEYTDEARKFKLNVNNEITIEILEAIHDQTNLHRRDYNLVPHLFQGQRELMVYSGVFQKNADLPYLYPVRINANSHQALEHFSQYYNHYHCPYLPIYDVSKDEMNTLFFGGIAQFHQKDDWLIQDNDVPFINTIAEIQRDKNGMMTESVLADTMPGLLGAGAVFVINKSMSLADNDIINASAISQEWQAAGYIYGGIRSSLPNIFWVNNGTESTANNTLYEVSIRKTKTVSSAKKFSKKENLQFYPNPAQRQINMTVDLVKPMEIKVSVLDISGKLITQKMIPKNITHAGKNAFILDKVDIDYGTYLYKVIIGKKSLSRKVIWSE